MEQYNLDFLFYQMPPEYRYQIDGDDDPNYGAVIDARIAFKEHMKMCDTQEYVTIIVRCFRDIYPNQASFWIALVKTEYVNLEKWEVPYRNEVKSIMEVLKPISDNEDESMEYIDQLEVTFKENQPSLDAWIEAGLEGKTFTKSVLGAVTTYNVTDSPILKIEVDQKGFTMCMDRESFIRY